MFLYDRAEEGFEPSLNLFQSPPVNTAVYQREYVSYRPITQISRGSPIVFSIPGSSSQYKDLRKTILHIKARIRKADGTPVTASDEVGFCNLTLQSLFRQVDVNFQHKTLSSSTGQNYGYKSYFDTLLKFEIDPKLSQLQAGLYYKDTGGFMDESSPSGGNAGLMERSSFTNDGEYVSLEGPLHLDICQQDRLIINGVQIDFKLLPTTDSFVLMCPSGSEQYYFEIGEAVLKVCQVKLNPGVLVSHGERIKQTPAIYPHMRSDLRAFNIQSGSLTWSADDLFQNQAPSRVVVGMVTSKAYAGSYQSNPYNFQHFNCSFMSLSVDGKSLPSEPFQCDFDKDQFVSAYLSLFTGVGKFDQNEGNFITRSDFSSGYSVFLFDVSGRRGKECLDLVKTGSTRLSIRFDKALQETVTCLVYSSFPNMIQIDEARNIVL